MKHLIAPAALAILAAAASPAAAQSADEKINMVIAYNESECPVAQPGEVVVCEILVEEDRYRIPTSLRYSDDPANVARARSSMILVREGRRPCVATYSSMRRSFSASSSPAPAISPEVSAV